MARFLAWQRLRERSLPKLIACAALLACGEGESSGTAPIAMPAECPVLDESAAPNVAGVFDYASQSSPVYGTITFAQAASEVRVTDTAYANADDRALEGTAALEGNRLQITLTPKNGDMDYEALVDFVFAEDGGTFCLLGFTDSNGDEGGPGSHYGVRRIDQE